MADETHLYAVSARVRTITERDDKGRPLWVSHRDTPTFYLDASVQGIIDADHAARLAGRVVDNGDPDTAVYADAYDTRTGALGRWSRDFTPVTT